MVAWGYLECFQNSSRVDLFQFACCEPLNISWQFSGKATAENLLGLLVLEAFDDQASITYRLIPSSVIIVAVVEAQEHHCWTSQ